jgi:short-chain Z-isoprenyl diphosphate synthase
MVRLIYRLYEHRLLRQLRAGPMSRPVGVILDGHRRFARQQGISDPRAIYELGARKLDEILDGAASSRICRWSAPSGRSG